MASIVITIATDGAAFDCDNKWTGLINVLRLVVDRLVRRQAINGMVLNDRYIVCGKVEVIE